MSYPSNSKTNSESVAQDQLKAFVERIMRMREEAKAINQDIREIYAEAKANGFDKTVLGKLVIHVERDNNDHAGMLEKEAIFDLYLNAYYGTGTRIARAHTHENSPGKASEGIDPSIANVSPEPPLAAVTDANAGGDHVATSAPKNVEISPDGQERGGATVPVVDIGNIVDERDSAPASVSAVEPGALDRLRLAHDEPPPHPGSFKNTNGAWRREGCQKPDACAGTWRERCGSCERAFLTHQNQISEAVE